jgi:hypothetical protein
MEFMADMDILIMVGDIMVAIIHHIDQVGLTDQTGQIDLDQSIL